MRDYLRYRFSDPEKAKTTMFVATLGGCAFTVIFFICMHL